MSTPKTPSPWYRRWWYRSEQFGHFLVVTLPAGLARAVWRRWIGEDPVIISNQLRSFERLNEVHCEFIKDLELVAVRHPWLAAQLEEHQRQRIDALHAAPARAFDCHLPVADVRYWWRRLLPGMPVQPCQTCEQFFWAGMPRFWRVQGKWQWTWLGGWNDYCCAACKELDD